MKENIIISIIIPYYKNKNFITKTINSLLSQTYKNFEILLIYDDKNTDDLFFLKKNFSKKNKIKIIQNKKNIGAGASRNVGINFANGKYVAFVDSDDYWHKDKLRIQLNYMIKNRLNLTHTNYFIINEQNKVIGGRTAKKIDYKMLLKSCDIGLSTVMINKSLLKKNKFPSIKTKEDYVLWLKILKKKQYAYPINKYLTYWRDTHNSLSSNKLQKIYDGYKVYRKYLKFSPLKSIIFLFLLSVNFLKKNI